MRVLRNAYELYDECMCVFFTVIQELYIHTFNDSVDCLLRKRVSFEGHSFVRLMRLVSRVIYR